MFLEPNLQGKRGWIEVITGSMFSGKTEELIRRIKRAEFANLEIEIYKPKVDMRYSEEEVVSHQGTAVNSFPVESSQNILLMNNNPSVIAIDEAQFFDAGLPEVCNILAGKGIRVIVAGLDMDFLGVPFGPMPQILAGAEYITKLHAICMVCGNIASYTYRTSADEKLVLLGEKDSYEARCRVCFEEGMKGRKK